jgi:hypothetical protein
VVGHEARLGKMRNMYKILVRKSDGMRPLRRPTGTGQDKRMGSGEGYGLNSSGSGYEPVAGSCEHSNEPLGSVKGGNFLTS